MENLWLAAGITAVATLALLRLRQMLRWVRCEATFQAIESPSVWRVSHMVQALTPNGPRLFRCWH